HSLYRLCDKRLHAANFHLNIEKCRACVAVKNVFQAGRLRLGRSNTFLELAESMPANRKTFQAGIMANDGLAIARAAHVKFEPINAMLQREIKSGNGVFRCAVAGAAMAEK